MTLALAHQIIGNPEHMIGSEDGFYYEQLNSKYLAQYSISDLPEKLKKYYSEKVALSYEEATDLAAKTADQIGRLWTSERNKRITGNNNCFSTTTIFLPNFLFLRCDLQFRKFFLQVASVMSFIPIPKIKRRIGQTNLNACQKKLGPQLP